MLKVYKTINSVCDKYSKHRHTIKQWIDKGKVIEVELVGIGKTKGYIMFKDYFNYFNKQNEEN